MEDGVVAVAHVLGPGKFGEGRVLALPDVVQLVRVAIHIAGREAFADEVGVVVVLPAVVVGEAVFEPSVAPHAEVGPINVGAYQCPAVADAGGFQSGFDINIGLLHRRDGVDDFVGPVGKVI